MSEENKIDEAAIEQSEFAEETVQNPETGQQQTAESNQGTELAEEKTETELLVEAQIEFETLTDKYLRQVSEFDNFRKRTIKEKTELILNGGQRVMESLLPILDDMQRAEANLETASDVEALKEGMNLIFSKLRKTLSAQGLKQMETADADFDTDFHEAVALVPAAEGQAKNKIIDCIEAGYTLNEKVIRHAKVVVSN